MAAARLVTALAPLMLLTAMTTRVSAIDYHAMMRTVVHRLSGDFAEDMHDLEMAVFKQNREYKPEFQENLLRSFGQEGLYGNGTSQITDACRNGTVEVLKGLVDQDTWAFQMLDATGKPESGILQGNILWLGSFSECQNVQAYYAVNDTNSTQRYRPLFDGLYCTSTIANVSAPTVTGVPLGITLGICIPDVCTQEDSILLINNTLAAIFPADIQVTQGLCHPKEGYPLSTAAIVLIALLSALGLVLVSATLYDILYIQSGLLWRLKNTNDPLLVNDIDDLDQVNPDDSHYVVEYTEADRTTDQDIKAVAEGSQGRFSMLMVRLSMYSNGAKILNTERSEASLDCLHGIRFLSMTWVILGHSYGFGATCINNITVTLDAIQGFAFQAILNASVSVDTFFLLSGTLVSYLLLKELRRKEGPRHVNWAIYYFHRYWRLTPPYMILLGFFTVLYSYTGTGPLWSMTGPDPDCSASWWANLLYLNNIIPHHKACFGWAWYLANDMQFYIVSPLFVVALYRKKILGLVLCGLALLGTTIANAVITQVYDLPAGMAGFVNGQDLNTYMYDLYMVPWCRIGPYIIGLLLGYAIVTTDRKFQMKWYLVTLAWAMAAAMALSVLYGQYGAANGHPDGTSINSLYASLNRTVWAVAVAWVIFACVSGLGGPVNTLLSWSAFVPLSRLTYMAYLIHPMVIMWYFNTRQGTFAFDHSTEVYIYLANLCVSYGLAFLCSLAFEAPMLGIEKVVFWKRT